MIHKQVIEVFEKLNK